MQWVEVKVGKLTRKFPVVSMGPKMRVVSVSLLGDVELVHTAAILLTEKVKALQPEVLVGPETKVVPLLQEMSRILGLPRYIVCRKGIQGYMISPVVVEPPELRTYRVRAMAIDGRDGEYLKGKRAVVVDDVIFTGSSLKIVQQILEKTDAVYAGAAAVFRQGERFAGEAVCLGTLPVFNG
ncbi:hypothetical protein A2701_04750 [Candidatus Amesbacteria bacterium RIFCSPHIGHO2_01_FULL_47_34]|uniref:Phosphoribosyltransferase domain-containing protein n=1 Tax=Candidatus Amesbacteria bacterium RIFCSPLOWO2_01_FULL_47_33 TaxID=1797258 RepID=A0A1F4Z5J7_9BACT|nr:MAG: hypothetical protein A2701_04750 [Candidatus Amesbacteria bacterium RIFCSPHIGHO2_01_FULL_47_34]OGD01267.1 MAG: hypothetical protein A2972_03445 [Candidatus Amesbacteria bacterium RIFCSPLOWO2_01_FULL_47_33]